MPRGFDEPAGAARDERRAALAVLALAAPLLLGLPALGALLAGRPLARYLEFPPLTRHVEHAPFAWPVFLLMAAVVVACVLPFLRALARTRAPAAPPRGRFPRWGWAALALTALAWAAAWTRLPLLAPLQIHTFTPLWLGYIGCVNALCCRRCGRSPLTHDTARYLALFPASAGFWWFFEYLNRFVQNWYYVGIDHLAPLAYAGWSTLAFATVLPAVAATHALLASYPRLHAGLEQGWRMPRLRALPDIVLVAAAAGLAALGLWPDWTYPLLWLAPLGVLAALAARLGLATPFSALLRGDWRETWLWALAALACGLFWETWNWLSAARWVYAVPWVQRFHVFEMPLLGYAGYLPFGLECAVATGLAGSLVRPRRRPRGRA